MGRYLQIKICLLLFSSSIFSGSLTAANPPNRQNRPQLRQLGETIYRNFYKNLQKRALSSRTIGFVNDLYASAPNDTVQIQFAVDPDLTLQSASAFVSMNDQQTWSTESCQPMLDQPGYENYWDCTVPTAGGSNSVWYLQLQTDAASGVGIITQSPKNITGEFPPGDNYLIPIVDEPVGDVIGDDAFLDISALSATYNDDSLFVRITVNEGGFYEGDFFGPWFLYGVGFSNPEQDLSADTLVVYSLGYGDGAFGNLYPGLLKLWGTSTGEFIDYQYITEDINWAISENVLDLAIATHYITDDPDFGDWPNLENALLVSGMTASTTLDIDFLIFDDTDPAMLILETNFQTGNVAPSLNTPVFDPISNILTISYDDPDHNLATLHRLSLGQDFTMIPQNHEYSAGVVFGYDTGTLSPGDYSARFDFSDGAASASLDFPFSVETQNCDPPGDVSGDGFLDILDVVTLVDLIINDQFNLCVDLNEDGLLNVSDVLVAVSTIMGR